MAKKGRKKITNPTDHTLYIRGYRAGLKAGYKKGLQAPGVVEQAMEDMFQLFKLEQDIMFINLKIIHNKPLLQQMIIKKA
jgi:flagellar biosynthesis/type III secretory pathway protein FliH